MEPSRVRRRIFSSTTAGGAMQQTCIVCLEEVSSAHDTTLKLPCGHMFHAACVVSCSREWKSSCPLCKKRFSRRLLRGAA